MRRYWREPHTARMFRGGELPRLMSAILMLAILYMLYGWMSSAHTWRWMARDDSKASPAVEANGPPTPPPTPAELPAATGPTDEDPEQAEEASQEFQVIADGSLSLQREEMEPYDRLVEWVKNQSFARLSQRAQKGVWYTDLHDAPNKYRGQIVALDLEIRRAKCVGENRYGVTLTEAWGLTEESRGRLYDVMVVDYPEGMPVGFSMYAKAKFVGYFLKLQGYESGGAKPGQALDKAPMLIGRLEWVPTVVVAPPIDNTQEWVWGLSALALVGLVLAVRFVYIKWFRGSPVPRSMVSDPASGEVIPIDTWLEQSSFGSNDDESDDAKER